MSPGEFIRLMLKRETLSMMNCYHITVVNLYQLPFKMSWNGSRDALRGLQLVCSAMFLQFLWKIKKVLRARPIVMSRVSTTTGYAQGLLIQDGRQDLWFNQNWDFWSGRHIEMSTLEHVLSSNRQWISWRFKMVLAKHMYMEPDSIYFLYKDFL